jgi:hypothetical protein
VRFCSVLAGRAWPAERKQIFSGLALEAGAVTTLGIRGWRRLSKVWADRDGQPQTPASAAELTATPATSYGRKLCSTPS